MISSLECPQTSHRTRSPLALVLGLVLASVLLVTGCGAAETAPSAGGPSAVAPTSPETRSAPAKTADPPATPTGPAPLPKASNTTVASVTISSIGLRTRRLEKLGLMDDGVLAAPKDPDRAGWFADGALPGDVGPSVIAGHVDSKTGPAVFADLGDVREGNVVRIGLTNGKSVEFVVDRVITTAKDGFPTDEVFGPTPDAELRLITCGGPYDRSVQSYRDNTIVFATRR